VDERSLELHGVVVVAVLDYQRVRFAVRELKSRASKHQQ
jgi:hypothetical protein